MDIVQNLPEGSDRATEDDEQGTSSRGGEPGLPKSWRGRANPELTLLPEKTIFLIPVY